MNEQQLHGRGATWFAALTRNGATASGYPASIRVADVKLDGYPARFIAVVPDQHNTFPRAQHGEVGLLEGWGLAQAVAEALAADQHQAVKRALIAVIDVPSQAYGRREEAFGIHQALAAAAGAYAEARQIGHPVIGLIVGKAMSGAFLAHGYQANRLIAFDDAEVMVHAMGKASAARVTLRSVEELEALAAKVAPMAYDIESYASLGLIWRLLNVTQPNIANATDLDTVESALVAALDDILSDSARNLRSRLNSPLRQASRLVREKLRAAWHHA